ncbi:uncharacterized protein PV09_04820 [Verruconis gallopava]|uniref:Uncharacterized protein n=1 Tax=Verruconis gallopava TaxID=253628 RepID=A0A0D2ABU8_9PEZI|nr:uncharacterized protein PV09_04820 [Verruconis gallopava]KIW03990.1 hypothetical protein PV09_04820 [Verruconis gallopava]
MSTVETLIHISAPTTRESDAQYRKQALSYSNFEPQENHHILMLPSAQMRHAGSEQQVKHDGATDYLLKIRPAMKSSQKLDAGESVLVSVQERRRTSQATRRSRKSHTPDRFDESTQQMLNTQHAAAGIQSQLSDNDRPESSTESSRPSKRQRLQRYRLRNRDQQNRFTLSSAALSPDHDSLHSSRTQTPPRARRDSQSAEVQSPRQESCSEKGLSLTISDGIQNKQDSRMSRDVSPSTAMEQEIEAFQAMRRLIPDMLRQQRLDPSQLQDFISSILPDTYNLSQSDGMSQVGNQSTEIKTTESAMSDVNSFTSKHIALPTVDQKLQNTDDPARAELVSNDINSCTPHVEQQALLQSEAVSSSVQLTSGASNQMLHEVPSPGCAVSSESHRRRHNYWETVLQETTENDRSLQTTSRSLDAHARGSTKPQKLKSSYAVDLKVPKPTQISPIFHNYCQQPQSQTALDSFSYDNGSLESLNTSLKASPLVNPDIYCALKSMPRQIFPPENISQNSIEPQDAQQSLLAEKHMLFRRVIHRRLDPLERGCWRVCLADWDPAFQLKFLTDLKDYLESGAMGKDPWVDIKRTQTGLPESLDLFCGVDSLGEMWLFLHVISEKQLALQDLHWLDCEGNPAVTMPARSGNK